MHMTAHTALDAATAVTGELLLDESVHLCDDSLALLVHQHHQVAAFGVELSLLAAQLLFIRLLLLCNLCLVTASQLFVKIRK